MKEYIHVNVRWRMHGLAVAYVSEHREIINQYAAQGYRFCDSDTDGDEDKRVCKEKWI